MADNKKVIVFGASGRTGKHFVEQALEAGLEITAFVRTPSKLEITHPSLHVVTGDALDEQGVADAIAGHDAVVSCLGSLGLGKSEHLTNMGKTICKGMLQHGVNRILYIASAGVENELPGLIGKSMSLMLRNVLRDHAGAIKQYTDAGMNITIARPMGLTDGPFTGIYRTESTGVPKGGRVIARADVAHFLLNRLLAEPTEKESIGLAY